MSQSLQLKQEADRLFWSGDFAGTAHFYSMAILSNCENPGRLYANRALAHIQLGEWDAVVADGQACLTLLPSDFKAHICLLQAKMALGDVNAAVNHAVRAYALCAAANSPMLCKRARWEAREQARTREALSLEHELLCMLRCQFEAAVAAGNWDVANASHELVRKSTLLSEVFERGRAESDRKRQVPEWAVDDISFCVMVDPVMTKTGKSYERASIVEHINRCHTDPVSREPLAVSDFRANLSLRQACDDFLDDNGWAADW